MFATFYRILQSFFSSARCSFIYIVSNLPQRKNRYLLLTQYKLTKYHIFRVKIILFKTSFTLQFLIFYLRISMIDQSKQLSYGRKKNNKFDQHKSVSSKKASNECSFFWGKTPFKQTMIIRLYYKLRWELQLL